MFKVKACNFIKKETLAQVFSCEFCEIFKNISLAQVFSCEFCEIFKNIYFIEHLRATASENIN